MRGGRNQSARAVRVREVAGVTDHSNSCSSNVVPDAPLMAACASSLVAYSTSA